MMSDWLRMRTHIERVGSFERALEDGILQRTNRRAGRGLSFVVATIDDATRKSRPFPKWFARRCWPAWRPRA